MTKTQPNRAAASSSRDAGAPAGPGEATSCAEPGPAHFSLDLPIPPSANNLFPGQVKRVKSTEYKAWLDAAGWEIKAQKPQPVTGPYSLRLMLPHAMQGDVSNRLKATEDLLVKHALTADDRRAMFVSAERSTLIPAGRCRVKVETWA
jgi:Holliday junction resolvase RusA-like endonuclease